ncbi:MAG TPA: hypothetical protein VIX84_16345 [Acidimicrobiales bacterium]
MKIFDFWREHRDAYARDGWVHIRNGVSPEFLSIAREAAARIAARQPLQGSGIKGAKEQFLFEFPESVDYGCQLFDPLARLAGLDRTSMTLSERHVKMYETDADPRPNAHKDRFSSAIAVGISVEVPPDSHLILYPHNDRFVNPFLSTGLRDSLEPDQLPENTLQDAVEVEIHDAAGDVVVFPGSSMWHLRRNAAGTVNIYLKFNDFDSDPLGEDPSTQERRRVTLSTLQGSPDSMMTAIPTLSRRFDSVDRHHRRDMWQQSLSAIVWGQPPVPISDAEFALLRSLNGEEPYLSVVTSPVHGLKADLAAQAIQRLSARGVLDLRPH